MSPTHRERCDSSPLTQASTREPPELPGGTLSEFSDLGPRAKIAQSYRGNQIMLPQTSLRSGLFSSLRYLTSGCSVLLAIVSIVIGIEVSVATASSGAAPSTEIINRIQKGDRLPVVPALHQNPVNRPPEVNLPRIPAPDQDLADGCESLASPRSFSVGANRGALPVLGERTSCSLCGAVIDWLARRRGCVQPIQPAVDGFERYQSGAFHFAACCYTHAAICSGGHKQKQ